MALPALKYITPEEYLEIEREADFKSEYNDGEMFAMAGGSRRHNAISTNIIAELRRMMKEKPCQVFNSDQKIHVDNQDFYTYPDAAVVCGQINFDAPESDIISDAIVIVEVLSESTAGYDRGKKFEFYRQLPSFSDYLLVDQERIYVEHFHKDGENKWSLRVYSGANQTIPLASLGCELALAEIYDKITWARRDK